MAEDLVGVSTGTELAGWTQPLVDALLLWLQSKVSNRASPDYATAVLSSFWSDVFCCRRPCSRSLPTHDVDTSGRTMDAARALFAAGGLRARTLVVPILEGNEWCALVMLGFPEALNSHMLEARRCRPGTQQRATQPALLGILADPASRGAGLRSQSVRRLQDVVTVASCLAHGLPTTTASLKSRGHIVRTLLTPIDLGDGAWEMDLHLTGPTMLAHVFFLLSTEEENKVSLMNGGREEWDGVLTARGMREYTRGLLLAHRHGPASSIPTMQGYLLLGWSGPSRHRNQQQDSFADHVRDGDNGQGRGRGARRRATAAEPGRAMCRSPLDRAGNNRGDEDDSDGQGKHDWDEGTVGGGGRRVHNANNAESHEASGIHSRDGHGHGSAGSRRRSSSRGSGGSYRERLQRAADANADSDRNSAGPLAGHSVAGRSPRVALTRGRARQPRTGGETVVPSSTPPMSRGEYVAALFRAADASKILDPRVGRLQAAVDVAAERNLSNQAAHRQDRDDKVAGAPRPSVRGSSSYAARTQTPPTRRARLGLRPSARRNPRRCQTSPDSYSSTDIVLDAAQHEQDVRRGRGGTARGGRGGGRIGLSAPAPARPPHSVPLAQRHSAGVMLSLHGGGSAQQERVGAGGNVPGVGAERAEAAPGVGLEGGGRGNADGGGRRIVHAQMRGGRHERRARAASAAAGAAAVEVAADAKTAADVTARMDGPTQRCVARSAPIIHVDDLPRDGLPYLIRKHSQQVEEFGAVIFRVSPSIRPELSSVPKLAKVQVQHQTFPMIPTVVSKIQRHADASGFHEQCDGDADAFAGILPDCSKREVSRTSYEASCKASAAELLMQFPDFGEERFLLSVNDPSVFPVRTDDRSSARSGSRVRLSAAPSVKVSIPYRNDRVPSRSDGLGRSAGDPDAAPTGTCRSPRDRLDSPRTINRVGMSRCLSTYEGMTTNMLYKGTLGSMFPLHMEDSNLLSLSFLQEGAPKLWWVTPPDQVCNMFDVLRRCLHPLVLAVVGRNIRNFLATKRAYCSPQVFLDNGVKMSLVRQEVGDYVVTAAGAPHMGLNLGANVASAVNYTCLAWFRRAVEYMDQAYLELRYVPFPFEKLLVLSSELLADGKWWFGSASSIAACDPALFVRDVNVLIAYLEQYLLENDRFVSGQGAGCEATAIDSVSPEVKAFLAADTVREADVNDGLRVDLSGDGYTCSTCYAVYWLSVVVCPTCISFFGGAPDEAPLCCWRCAESTYRCWHVIHEEGKPDRPVAGSHKPLVVWRHSTSQVRDLVAKMRRLLETVRH